MTMGYTEDGSFDPEKSGVHALHGSEPRRENMEKLRAQFAPVVGRLVYGEWK